MQHKLWDGRFLEKTDSAAITFHSSILFDSRMFQEDIWGSISHAQMLFEVGVLTEEECTNIVEGLRVILKKITDGEVEFSTEDEDIHMSVERMLTELIGEDAKKLHTGRSRNDQVATDIRLYLRKAVDDITSILKELMAVLIDMAKTNLNTYMSAYTHLQKAQPTTLAHYMMAYFEMFKRDYLRFTQCRERINVLPLGSGALCATTYPLDRHSVARKLSFDGITANSLDGVSDRDFICEFLSNASLTMVHLSRFCEEIVIFSSNEFGTFRLSDKYSTGSSIMPQKKNPDMAELIRGKSGRVFGDLMAMLTVLKGLPLAYNKDMQEDKECVFDAYDTLRACLNILIPMVKTMTFDVAKLRKSALNGFTNATDLADYLVGKGITFRDAHHISGKLVAYCEGVSKSLLDLTLEEFKSHCPAIEKDVYEMISLEACVQRRCIPGGPAREMVEAHIGQGLEFLAQ